MEQEIDLILASGSPRRNDLLREAGFCFEIDVPEVEEIEDAPLSPTELTITNALIKARAIASQRPEHPVLGADTLVFLGSRPLGKPADLEQAFAMVRDLAGKSHQVCTGVALIQGTREHTFHELTTVEFKELSDQEIREYHALINPLDKAGAYAAQDHGDRIIERFDGLWSNVVGLPVERVGKELQVLADLVGN